MHLQKNNKYPCSFKCIVQCILTAAEDFTLLGLRSASNHLHLNVEDFIMVMKKMDLGCYG